MGNLPDSGNLAEVGFCEILAALCRGHETGVLRLTGGTAEKSVYLQQGKIVFASSKDPDDRLGELLLTRGIIQREQLEEATIKVGPGKRLGAVLVEMGILPAADLPRWVREQVKEILFSLFSWTEGSYRFEEGPFSSEEAITLRLSLAEIFLAGLRQVQKWSVLRKGAGEIRLPYRLCVDHNELLKEVSVGQEEKRLLSLLESKPASMEQAALESGLSTLRVYQLFFAFRVLGVVVPQAAQASDSKPRVTPAQPASPDSARSSASPAVPEDQLPAAPSSQPPSIPIAQEVSATPEVETTIRLVEPAPQAPGARVDVGAQTVILKMPVLEEPSRAAASSRPPARSGGGAPADSPRASNPAAAAPSPKEIGSGSAAGIPSKPAPPPAPVSRTHVTASDAAAPRDIAPTGAPARRSRGEYRVVRVEGEKLDGSGAQHIEDLLRQWSGKGYRLLGVVPGRKEGLFNASSCCFFIFERDSHS